MQSGIQSDGYRPGNWRRPCHTRKSGLNGEWVVAVVIGDPLGPTTTEEAGQGHSVEMGQFEARLTESKSTRLETERFSSSGIPAGDATSQQCRGGFSNLPPTNMPKAD